MVNIVPSIVAEIQARYASRVFSGKIQLPDEQTRMKEVDDVIAEYLKTNDTLE